jgi:predicted SAM-dependent methyltransferase
MDSSSMKLNIGCGNDFRRGWLNVDCRRLYADGAEFLCRDIFGLEQHLEDGTATCILARDVLEYLPWREVDAMLALLGRKLRPGGVLSLRVPDGEQIARAYMAGTLTHHDAQRLLYGDQGYPEAALRSLWSAAVIQRRLEMIGLKVERLERKSKKLVVRARRPT